VYDGIAVLPLRIGAPASNRAASSIGTSCPARPPSYEGEKVEDSTGSICSMVFLLATTLRPVTPTRP
jgi:hypothetical protein